ncbi:MAG: response regulator [Phycisphaerae bacterium]|nr:response regulator [Phycisphaerae bacterium]
METTRRGEDRRVGWGPATGTRESNGYDSPRDDTLEQAVAQRQEAETRIIDQLRLFAALLEAIPNPVFYTGIDGRYLGCNQAFAQLVGIDADSIAGRLISDIWPGQDTAGYIARNKELLRDGGVQHYEDTVVDAGGAIRNVIIQKALYEHADGSLGGIVGVMIDITDRKKAEEERLALQLQMQQTQRLESLGVLAGGVAHDFNNLLMVILGNIDLALKDLSDHSPIRELIENVKTASLRASELTNQMLAYAGKGRLKIQDVSLNDLIHEMTHLLQVSISRKAEVQYDLADNLPYVEGDPAQLRQIVMNLITNASEALGNEPGKIHVRTDVITVDEKTLSKTYLNDNLPAGQYVRFEVSDNGHGIDEEHLTKIFEPFFTTKFTGRGLGLAAVLGITRSHKGAIDVASENGDGTTFTVLLPVKSSPPIPNVARPIPQNTAWRGRGTVLLVDDEPAICKIGSSMLQRLGFETLVAQNGPDALDVFRKRLKEIDLILLDVSMPMMDGTEACAKFRSLREDVRIVLCTGHAEVDAIMDSDGEHPVGFLQKPFDLHTLSAKLQDMLA